MALFRAMGVDASHQLHSAVYGILDFLSSGVLSYSHASKMGFQGPQRPGQGYTDATAVVNGLVG
jgi:hypothetical protein